MTQDAWRRIVRIDPEVWVDTTLTLHWAVQLVASVGQTFATPASDDSHRAMSWDPEKRAFVGAPFAAGYPFRIALRPGDLTLLLLDRTGADLASLPLAGERLEEAYQWIGVGVATYLGQPAPMVERPEYDMPLHPIGDGASFPSDRQHELGVLGDLYHTAWQILHKLSESQGPPPKVLCWPHHFDIATLLVVEPGSDEQPAKTVGIGLSPMGGDGEAGRGTDLWYWYVSPWPYPPTEDLPAPPALGHWNVTGWTGLVLPADAVLDASPSMKRGVVEGFLDDSIQIARDVLVSDP